MSILLLLIPLGLLLVVIALWAFFWAVDHDQFEDLDRAAHSILFDDDLPRHQRPEGEAGEQSAQDIEPATAGSRGDRAD